MLSKYAYVVIALVVCGQMCSQTNRLNKKGQKTGKWIIYQDSAKKIKSSEGSYRNGKPRGVFYYYNPEGILERKERTIFSVLYTTSYYSNKIIRSRGKARIENLPLKVHYYYYGRWKYYDTLGNPQKYIFYEKGNVVKTKYLDKNSKVNDSLIDVLNQLDKRFNEYNAALLDSIAHSAFNIARRERLQLELYMRDTLSYSLLQKLLIHYGYPTKEKVQQAVVIPFYLLSFAPAGIRENYLDLLKNAANKGDLEWKSLAFYIDKLQLAQNKKQIYGTQYYYKNNQMVFYSTVDPETLEQRRKEIGL